MQESDVLRPLMEDLIGTPFAEEAWGYIASHGFVQPILDGNPRIGAVVDQIRDFLRASARPLGQKGHAPRMLQRGEQELEGISGSFARQVALSLVTAIEAMKDGRVQYFRDKYIHTSGKVVAWENVEAWIAAQADRDGAGFTWWFTSGEVPMEGENPLRGVGTRRIDYQITVPESQLMATAHWRLLHYAQPGDKWERLWATHKGGILEELWSLAALLAERYRWTEGQATLFLLTDLVPLIGTFDAEIVPSDAFPALWRMVLVVDPSLTANDISEQYLQNRERFTGARPRDLTEKHLALALFTAQQPEGETWAERMKVWNQTHREEWGYQVDTHFGRDAANALRRLLRPDYRF